MDRVVCATGALAIPPAKPEKRLRDMEMDQFQALFQINASGPLTLLGQLEPLLKRSASPRIAALSAQLGSITDNRMGGWYAYRMSKSALNMGIRTLAIECARWPKPPVIAAIHPGTTLTTFSAAHLSGRERHLKSPTQTAQQIVSLLERMDNSHNGGFFNTSGGVIEW